MPRVRDTYAAKAVLATEGRVNRRETAHYQALPKPSQGLEPWTPSLPSGSEQEPESTLGHSSPFVDEDPDS